MPGTHLDGPRTHPLVATLAALNALAAGFGAVGLVTGWLSLGPTVTGRLPWDSAVLGGVALAVLVALPNALLAVVAARRDRRCGLLTQLTGLLLVGWIAGEVVVIREYSVLQPAYAVNGLLLIWLGVRIGRRTGVVAHA